MSDRHSSPPPPPPQSRHASFRLPPPKPPSSPMMKYWAGPPAPPKPPQQRYRPGKSDGALIAWTALCALIPLIALPQSTPGDGSSPRGSSAFLIWVVPAFWLTIIYLIARAGRRRCPVCGTHVPTGRTQCVGCGHQLRGAIAQPLGAVRPRRPSPATATTTRRGTSARAGTRDADTRVPPTARHELSVNCRPP